MKRKRNNKKTYALIIGVLAIIIVLVVALVLVGKSKNTDEVTTFPTTAEITTEEPTVATTVETTVETTKPEPTQIVNSKNFDFSKQVPKSKSVDNSYFNDAIFIGNSRTEGFFLYTGLKGARMYAHKGLMVNTFFTDKLFAKDGNKITMLDAIKADNKFTKVYIMLGMNELGWGYPKLFIEKYTLIIKELKAINPNAAIYIQSILPVTEKKSKDDAIYNMGKINEFNNLLRSMATENNVYYLNALESVSANGGFLPEDAAYDGVHLKAPYCNKWLEYLKSHTVG